MFGLYRLKLKTQLLILMGLMVSGFLLAGYVADRSLSEVLVKGKVYNKIQEHKDLAADILPPPAYLIESWQLALEMSAIQDASVNQNIKKGEELSKQFDERLQYWIETQPQFNDILQNKLYPTGKRFIEIRNAEYIPAIKSGDKAKINTALLKLRDAYLKHRAVIDELVSLNDKAYKSIENEVPVQVSDAKQSSLILALMALGFALFGVFAVVGNVIRQLGGEASQALIVAQNIADGDFESTASRAVPDRANVIGALSLASETLVLIDHEMRRMEIEHDAGNIDANIDVSKFKGAYYEMAVGINRMVANHIEVMKKTSTCLMGLAKGDFDAELETFPGKLALVNDGVEGLRSNVRTLISDMRHMAEQHAAGNIDVYIDANKFQGDYKLLAIGVNEMVAEYIDENKTVMDCVLQFGNGDFSASVKEYPGEKAFINKSIKKISGSLRGLIESVKYVSAAHDQGEVDMDLRDDMFKGDFSALAKSVNKMMDGLRDMSQKSMQVVKAFGEGDFDAPLESFPGKKAVINETIEQVRSNLKALNEDAQMLADSARNGNVYVRADASRHQGDYKLIVEGMNQTLDMIVAPIVVIKDAAETINTAAKEIAQGNSDLSRRTEDQAANLEKTSSRMDLLASSVTHNAENARVANQMAISASEVAEKGGIAVNEVINTMSVINESARKIEDIISVIDGIAFQTNILALNAAVEAARAGEQGRGFAVVAGEVRNLAQRSSTAAKEIKELITDSVNKTNDGTKQVEIAGNTMHEIVSSVKHVSGLISEIAASSIEQSNGIVQVNEAIIKMDDMTQQNTALVEQAAAAAESLMDQAEELTKTVSVFSVDGAKNGKSKDYLKAVNA